MTEAEWLSIADCRVMLAHMSSVASGRKLRYYSVACCRTGWDLFPHERYREAVVVAERFADGLCPYDDLHLAWLSAYHIYADVEDNAPEPLRQMVIHAGKVGPMASARAMPSGPVYADLLRDIFGNPFRPVTLGPAWLTPTVVALAEGIYQERAFDQMPILADALQDAGCENEDVLNHCRSDGPHVRGCWAVDLLLGKT
jgi:hypothetical protein